MHLKVSSAKRRPFCLGLNELIDMLRTATITKVVTAMQSIPIEPTRTKMLLLELRVKITKHMSNVAIKRLVPIIPLRMESKFPVSFDRRKC